MIIPLGGGGSKIVASIVVSYPAGSTCTCTLGSRVLTAKDTSGKWVFGLPSTGSWVVASTSGDKTASKTVSITTEGQVETVGLAYELVLFDNGVVNGYLWDANDRSGGTNDSTSSVSTKISLIAYGYWDGNYYSADATRGTSDSFDLSTYSTLKIQVSAVSSFATRRVQIGSTSLEDDIATMNISSTGTVSCDISAINSQCFISFFVSTRGQSSVGTASLDVTKIWLE